jgi:hypothetical protein
VAHEDFQYALLQVVPRVERDERFNAGIVLFSRRHGFLGARVELDRDRLAALDRVADADGLDGHLRALAGIAAGDPAAGPIAAMPQSERFHWLVAPSSTVIQPSAVHTGLSEDPARTLDHLFASLVARPTE